MVGTVAVEIRPSREVAIGARDLPCTPTVETGQWGFADVVVSEAQDNRLVCSACALTTLLGDFDSQFAGIRS